MAARKANTRRICYSTARSSPGNNLLGEIIADRRVGLLRFTRTEPLMHQRKPGLEPDRCVYHGASAKAPQSINGPRIFQGVGTASAKLGAASFSMAAHLALQPGSGAVGSTAAVEGYGFGPFEEVNVYWNNPRIFLGAVKTDIYGAFSGDAAFPFTIPSGAATGANGVFGRGLNSH